MKRALWTCLVCILCLFASPAFAGPLPIAPSDGLFAQGLFESARQAYAAAVAAAPEDAAPRIGLIRTLLRLDRWPDAVTEAQAAAKKFPANADTHGLLALALIRAGWQSPYADEAKQALALDANNYWGLVASGRAADWDGHLAEARKLFRQASTLRPDLPDAWNALLQIGDETGQLKEEVAVAQAYLKLNPHGHPHDETAEDAQDLCANAPAYQTAFGADPPYQHAAAQGNGSAAPEPAKPLPLAVDFQGDYAVFPVTLNGISLHLLFDTGGGDDILLNWNAARRLHLPALAHSFVRGVSGKEKSDTLKADTLTLAELKYKSIKIVTAAPVGSGIDGILGGSILRDSVVTLDIGQRTATLAQGTTAQAPAPLPGNGSISLPFHFYHGKVYVPVSLNTVPAWALVDTGSLLTTLSLRMARDQLKDTPKNLVHAGSFSGRRGIGSTERQMEYVASRAESALTLSQTPPVSIPIPTIGTSDLDRQVSPEAACDFEVSVWLGMSSLTYARRLTLDYPRRLLTFEYKDPDAVPVKAHRK